jgi:hypothetical protein
MGARNGIADDFRRWAERELADISQRLAGSPVDTLEQYKQKAGEYRGIKIALAKFNDLVNLYYKDEDSE